MVFDVSYFLLLVSILEAQEWSRGGRSGFSEARDDVQKREMTFKVRDDVQRFKCKESNVCNTA